MLASWMTLELLPRAMTADEIKVCLASNVLEGISPADARAATTPMIELLSQRVSYPVSVDIADAHDLKGLEALARKTFEGKLDLLVIWGIEYGWLKKKHPELKLESLMSVYVETGYDVLLMVTQAAKNQRLAALQGKKLAGFRRQALMVQFSMENLLRKEGLRPDGFFQAVEARYPTPQATVLAVRNGDADCLLIDSGTWAQLQRSQPGLARQVAVLRRGPALPPPVVVGRRENLEGLRHGLWKDLQTNLETIHRTAEGKQCVRFWSIQKFERVDEGFEDLVDRAGQDLLEWSNRFHAEPK